MSGVRVERSIYELLQLVGGFTCGDRYLESIGCEVLLSQRFDAFSMAQNSLLPSELANAASLTEAANVERSKHTDSFFEESSQSLPSRY